MTVRTTVGMLVTAVALAAMGDARAASPVYAGRTKPQAISYTKGALAGLVAAFAGRTDAKTLIKLRTIFEGGTWSATKGRCKAKPAWVVRVRYTPLELRAAKRALDSLKLDLPGTEEDNSLDGGPFTVTRAGLQLSC